jgi:hypothetical protein
LRFAWPSYFCTTNSRYQRRIVSGVASVATSRSPFTPELVPQNSQTPPLGVGEANASAAELLAKMSDLLALVLDQLLLVAPSQTPIHAVRNCTGSGRVICGCRFALTLAPQRLRPPPVKHAPGLSTLRTP